MATVLSSISLSHSPALLTPFKTRLPNSWIRIPNSPSLLTFPIPITQLTTTTKASSSSSGSARVEDNRQPSQEEEQYTSVDALQRFIQLNLGKWNGTFFQFDCQGNLMQKINTKLSVGSYGEDELISLIQTLYIKQSLSTTSISGVDHEPEWFEYKIKETNMFTVDKYQQIGFFPKERAFALRYQTAGMLETVLRQGVLGEDDTGEESPKNLKLPSRRPSIVCENCLYSLEKDQRIRAFHIMDPQGFLDMMLVFLEERSPESTCVPPSFDDSEDDMDRIKPYLGTWKGHSVTKRSGVYGSTLAKADTVAVLEMNSDGQLVQDINSTADGKDVTTNVHWTGNILKNVVTFDGGFQLTLLPGGVYMGCPCDIRKTLQESYSFHLEFCWLESPGKRQRLVRTYDMEGQAVSSTYFFETKFHPNRKFLASSPLPNELFLREPCTASLTPTAGSSLPSCIWIGFAPKPISRFSFVGFTHFNSNVGRVLCRYLF